MASGSQERRILDLVGQGVTSRQIGGQLFLAQKTVKELRLSRANGSSAEGWRGTRRGRTVTSGQL